MYKFHNLLITLICILTISAEAKIWTNAKGQTIEAEFFKLEDDLVHLKKAGRIYKIPLNTLSKKCQTYVKDQLSKEKASTNVEADVRLPIKLKTKISGEDLFIENISKKPIVIHQWQAHCGACSGALVEFEKLARRKKRSGANFMIWHSHDTVALAKKKSEAIDLDLPVYHGKMIPWNKKFGKFVWPHVVLIDAQGEIVYMGKANREFTKLLQKASQ